MQTGHHPTNLSALNRHSLRNLSLSNNSINTMFFNKIFSTVIAVALLAAMGVSAAPSTPNGLGVSLSITL